MQFGSFIEWAFLGIVSGGVLLIVQVLKDVKNSIQHLNERLSVLIEKTIWHEKELVKHEERISNLEITKHRGTNGKRTTRTDEADL